VDDQALASGGRLVNTTRGQPNGGFEMALKKGVKQMVDEANAKIKTLSVEEARELLDDPNYQFVDIRDIRELEREGQIPGAYHAPRGMLEFWVDPASPYHKSVFDSGKTFVFYCRSGWRSALSTATLQEMGLEPVCHIGGGFGAWMEAEAPIVPYHKKEEKK
jgi:rhodanese-related sulfurtransferase